MRYAMAIDKSACVGCHSCAVACKSNNNLPNGIWWNRVLTDGGEYMDTARGTYPNDLHKQFVPLNCQHCENPACVKVCPVGATYKREDGIVMQDPSKCIGCRMCMAACPYNVRVFNWKEPEYVVDFPLGDADAPKHVSNTVEKCNFCVNRIDRGAKPACMECCPGRARYWGDLDDPNSEISVFLEGKKYTKLLEDKGTNPSVFYVG
ncbi:MAG: 4Fe-4S dicluster domain-containing protein [Coriobacteriia bacterium]